MPPSSPELLAPAGDATCLQAALDAGADAVYLGLDRLHMRRAAARNFTLQDLPGVSRLCQDRGARLYLALNSIVYEPELPAATDLVAAAAPHVDAVIAADWAVMDACIERGVPFHVSTQMSVSNSAAARRLHGLGARRIVLARECTLAEIAAIRAAVPGLQLEAFVHGAMCVSVSGRCLLSHEAYGLSGNRGECRQPCRREYEIRELDGENAAFVVGRGYVLSPRDLCSLPFLDELVAAGIGACKIEGRSRNAEYVHTVVGAYRAALDALAAGALDAARKQELVERCRKVFHRGFSVGHYFGRPASGDFTDGDGNAATCRKEFVGRVRHYYPAAGAVDIEVQDAPVAAGDTLMIQGVTSGVVTLVAQHLRRDAATPVRVESGWFTVACPSRVRQGDRVYRLTPRA